MRSNRRFTYGKIWCFWYWWAGWLWQTNKERTRNYPHTSRIQIFQKDCFLLISGCVFCFFGYILYFVGLCIHADFVQWMLLAHAIAFAVIIGSRSILVKKIIFSHGMYQVLSGTAEKIAFSGKIMAKFRSENGVLLDPLIPIVTNGKQNIKAGDPVLLVYEETTDMRFVIKHEREGFVWERKW